MISLRVSRQRSGRPTCLAMHAEQRLLRVARDLGAEAAADVGRDDLHLVGARRRCAATIASVRALRALGAEPLVQAAVDPGHRRAAHLERARGDALVDEAALDDHLAAVEERVAGVLGHAERGGVEHDVAAGALVDAACVRVIAASMSTSAASAS